MLREVLKQIKVAILLLFFILILTGMLYPAVITGIAQLVFPCKANGSLIMRDNKLIGSFLIGQSFSDSKYFWSRPSATSPFPYNAASSSGSNLGPSNPVYLEAVKKRTLLLKKSSNGNQDVPVDLVTASGSGLDPEISPEAAYYQVARIAKARGISEQRIQAVIQNSIQRRTLGILGEPRVNVLTINLALDRLSAERNEP